MLDIGDQVIDRPAFCCALKANAGRAIVSGFGRDRQNNSAAGIPKILFAVAPVDRVGSGPRDDRVVSPGCRVDVIASATFQHVGLVIAQQRVIAIVAVQIVLPELGDDLIVARAAMQIIVAIIA